jgi:hypothetical protein
MTLSASLISAGGTLMPSALAVSRLMRLHPAATPLGDIDVDQLAIVQDYLPPTMTL